MRKIICFMAAALVVPLMLSGCKFGFQGNASGAADNSENTVSFVDDGSPKSVLYKLQNACVSGDADTIAALLNLKILSSVTAEDENENNDFSAVLSALLHNLSFSDITEEYIDDIAGEAKLTANVTMLDIKQYAADNPDIFEPMDSIEQPENGDGRSAIVQFAEKLAAYDKITVKEKVTLRFSYKDGRWELNGEMLLKTFLGDLQSVAPSPEGDESGWENPAAGGGESPDNADNVGSDSTLEDEDNPEGSVE